MSVDHEDPSSGEVWGFYVATRLQKMGFGGLLWQHLMGESQTRALNSPHLSVAKDSVNAITFYERRGFIQVGEEERDWPSWTDEHPMNQYWIMEKSLQP